MERESKRAGGVRIVVATTLHKGEPLVRDSVTIALPGRHSQTSGRSRGA